MTVGDRNHALDALRGAAMFLGIVLHAILPYLERPVVFWPVRDPSHGPAADVFALAVHDFRMQTFFVLAGFFGGLLHHRYGLRGMLRHRGKRVLLPLVLGMLTVVPLTGVIAGYAEVVAARNGTSTPGSHPFREAAAKAAADETLMPAEAVVTLFRSGTGEVPPPMHLWFLYYLVLCYAAAAVVVPLAGRLAGSRLGDAADAAFRRVVLGRGRFVVPAAVAVPFLAAMRGWTVDTPNGWVPPPPLLGYYLGFFAFGWLLYRHRDLVPAFGRGWRTTLVVGNVLVFPLMLGLVMTGTEAAETAEPPAWLPAVRVAAMAASALYTWLMIAGFWGLFLRYFADARPWVRYLADASYWCYLASLPPIVLFQFWAAALPLPWELKLLLVTGATTAVLLVSYEWGVRYTLVGAVLNGRKVRPSPAPSPVPEAVRPT